MSDRYLQSLAEDYMDDECNRADHWNDIEWQIIHACETGDITTSRCAHGEKHA